VNKKISRLLRARKALSPVIATVILVAVTIVVAVSVAFWMGSIAGTYTSFEQVQITSAPVYTVDDWNDTSTYGDNPWNNTSGAEGWRIRINLKNTGSADATIDNVMINGKPFSVYSNVAVRETTDSYYYQYTDPLTISIGSGTTDWIEVIIKSSSTADQGVTFTSGLTLDIKLHSAAGKEYPQIVTLS